MNKTKIPKPSPPIRDTSSGLISNNTTVWDIWFMSVSICLVIFSIGFLAGYVTNHYWG